jgi:hypothetical protein
MKSWIHSVANRLFRFEILNALAYSTIWWLELCRITSSLLVTFLSGFLGVADPVKAAGTGSNASLPQEASCRIPAGTVSTEAFGISATRILVDAAIDRHVVFGQLSDLPKWKEMNETPQKCRGPSSRRFLLHWRTSVKNEEKTLKVVNSGLTLIAIFFFNDLFKLTSVPFPPW